MSKNNSAFTIVELLIVIVVIAILAAISIVAYTGIQQRATNTAIINTANQTLKMVQAYATENDSYPDAVYYACVTTTSGCANSSAVVPASSAFDTNMEKTGAVPKSTATLGGTTRYGVMYSWHASRTLDGQSRPALLLYYLQGVNQPCGMQVTDSFSTTMATTSLSYTNGNSGGTGKTACVVSIPGPGV